MRNKNFISNVYLDKFINTIKKNKNYEGKPETYFSYFEKEIIEKSEIKEIQELVEGLIISGMLHYTGKNSILEIYSDSDKTDKIYSIKLVNNLKKSEMKIGKFEDFEVIKYSKENNLDFAIITDAVNWRIYNLKEINYYDNYIEIDITSYLLKQEFSDDILFLCEFFDVNNFFRENKEETRKIDKIFFDSAKEIEALEKNIKSVIEPILTDISNGFINSIAKTTYNDKERREIYIDSIVLLYRILFVLYAESRELFPTTSEAYQKASLTQLIEKSKDLFETEKLIGIENEFTLYDKFDRLVNWIDGGGQEVGITAYNRGLFRNSDKPILRNFKLKNKYFSEVILKLGYFQNKNGDYTDKIDYRDLTVRNLGTFYEGILEYNLFIAEEELVKRSQKGKVEFIPTSETTLKRTEQGNIIKKGEVYLSQDKGERKETGAYYTPEPIVEYIVSNTVDKKLEELKSDLINEIDKINNEIKNAIIDREIRILNISKLNLILDFINNKVLKLSVLDNAMGSGHFLVNAALHISNFVMELIYENLNFEIEDEEYDEIGSYNYWKRMVITHCIYGVDINELAVQLGKLSLWLVSTSKDKPLSFLDHHLKCGNSLLGTSKKDIETTLESGSKKYLTLFDTTLNTVVGKLTKIYGKISQMPEDTAEEVHLKEEKYEEIVDELEVVKAKFDLYLNMQIEDKKGEVEKGLFEDIAKSSIEDLRNRVIHKFDERMKFSKENKFFHWELEFPEVFRGENGGFDCVIGNPPYVLLQDMDIEKEIKTFYNKSYEVSKYKIDLYNLFVEKSYIILRSTGNFSYIIPSNFQTNTYSTNFRNYLIKNFKLSHILNINNYVFNIVVNNCVLFLEKEIKKDNVIFKKSNIKDEKLIFLQEESKSYEKLSLDNILSFPPNKESRDLLEKIILDTKELGEISNVNFGMQLRNSKVFTHDILDLNNVENIDKVTEFHRECYTGRNIKRYKIEYSNLWCYFNREAKCGGCWDEKAHNEKNKILVSQVGKFPNFSLDENGFALLNTAFMISNFSETIKYLYVLSILNSKLIRYFWISKFSDDRDAFPKIKGTYLKKLPIKLISEKRQEIFAIQVNEVMNLKKLVKETHHIEDQIDQMVYKIYDLTEEEIAIVEYTVK